MRALSYCLAFLGLLACGPVCAGEMPDLLPLSKTDLPQAGGCQFGREPGKPLLYWPQEEGQPALVRDAKGLRKLRFFSAKHMPVRRDPPRVGDHQALMFSDADWHVQAVGEVVRAHAPKAGKCGGVVWKNRLIVLWAGHELKNIDGWGHCGCGG